MEIYHFRRNLLKIYQNLSKEDINNLVYISPECPEDVKSGREYCQLLEKKGLIGPTNYDYLLDRLIDIGREDLAFQLMERVCQSPHTPSSLSTHLLARLLGSGREDLAIELMKCKCRVPHLPSGLSSAHQMLLMVFNAKQGICTAHRRAIAKLCDPVYAMNEMGGLLEAHFCQIVLQSTKVDMAATVYQWSNFSVFEDRGTLGELLENTLESIFSFADAFRTHIVTILSSETAQLQSIEPSATACTLAFDRFSEALADSGWNHDGRQDPIIRRTKRDFPIDTQAQSACKTIADLCEGISDEQKIEEAEGLVKEELFTFVTGMYACWYSTPMYHWMRTLIQLAASSKLDLTRYHEHIIKVVTRHREPIIQYYSKFTQLLGRDILKMVDPILNMPQPKTISSEKPTATTETCTRQELYMAVYWYMYLLQLVALAAGSSSSQWEMAKQFAKIHQEFHQNSYAEALKSSMEVAGKLIIATNARVESFRLQAIQLCPEPSAENVLLSKLLPDIDTHK